MSTFLTRQFDLAHLAPRHLWQLTWKTLLGIYLGLSLSLLSWLCWMPKDELKLGSYPGLMVVVDGEEGRATYQFCAYGIAWIEAKLLGVLPINLPQVNEGRLLNCHYVKRTEYWNEYINQNNDADWLL